MENKSNTMGIKRFCNSPVAAGRTKNPQTIQVLILWIDLYRWHCIQKKRIKWSLRSTPDWPGFIITCQMWPSCCNQHFQHLDWTQDVNAVEAEHKLAKPRLESKTLIHYSYLKGCTQKSSVLVLNFRQFLFRSLTLIWTPRISTWLNSSSSWLKLFSHSYLQVHHPVQSNWIIQGNDAFIAEDLNLRKKRTPQCISTSNSAVLQSRLHKRGAKGAPLLPWQFQMRILLQGL